MLQARFFGRVQRKSGSNASGWRLRVEVFVNGAKTQEQVFARPPTLPAWWKRPSPSPGSFPGDVVTVQVKHLFHPAFGLLFFNLPETLPENRRQDVRYTGSGF